MYKVEYNMVRRDDVQWCDLKQTELCCRKEATTTPAPAEDEKKNKEHNLPCLHWDIDDGTVDGVRFSIKISLDDGRDEERASFLTIYSAAAMLRR